MTMLRWLWVSGLVVVIDRATKVMAESWLVAGDPVAVAPLFNFSLAYNTGAAFSFLSSAGGWQRWLFSIIAVVFSAILIVWLHRLERRQRTLAVALTLVLGGALGNLWDRIVYGHVVDFLDVYVGRYHWPAFNIADSAITVGAILLLWDTWRGEHHKRPEQSAPLSEK